MGGMFALETHCHTRYSGDSLVDPAALVAALPQKKIDRVVITDHNEIAGAQIAFEIDPQRVIIGEEIMTREGELLAAFVRERVPPGLKSEEAIRILRAQDAFISVSHPFDRTRKGHWKLDDLLRIAPLVDAVEIFNSRSATAAANKRARRFAIEHHLLGTAGSDAHTISELGRAVIRLAPFTDAQTLRMALQDSTIQARLSSPWVHFASRYAVWYKKLHGLPLGET